MVIPLIFSVLNIIFLKWIFIKIDNEVDMKIKNYQYIIFILL
jgi:hypothetical protein